MYTTIRELGPKIPYYMVVYVDPPGMIGLYIGTLSRKVQGFIPPAVP